MKPESDPKGDSIRPAEPSRDGVPDVDALLEELRRRIDTIDRKIVENLAERQKVVAEVLRLKKAHHLPVYHPSREEDLISDRRIQGQRAGLHPDDVEELFRQILRQSRKQQSERMARKGIRAGVRILLVGGHGEMGRYFFKWFSAAGYEVNVMDRGDWERAEALCRDIALAVLTVPIEVTASVARKLGPYLPARCVLADITSNKEAPLKAMLDAHSGPVVGLHPLFGPTTTVLDKQTVVVTPGRDAEACQWVVDQFAAWGAIIVEAGAREHDEAMGVVQALRHFATFNFGRFLSRQNIDLKRTLEFSSPIYRLELGMVGRLFAQDPALYAEIIFASPKRRALLKSYLDNLMETAGMLETGDKELFCIEFRKITEWFGPFGEQAMRESSYLIDKLIERF